MKEEPRVDRYAKIVLTLIVIFLAALLCKPFFVAKPVAGMSGFSSVGKGFHNVLGPPDVYYLGLRNEEILSTLKKEWSDLQKKISEMTPDEKKEFTDDELKLHAKITEITYDELKNMEKVRQVNIILVKLYSEGYRVKFVTDAFIILEK